MSIYQGLGLRSSRVNLLGFVFCHGWGYDASFGEALKKIFAQNFPTSPWVNLDLGYFGQPTISVDEVIDSDISWVGIGHSLGFSKLVQAKVKWTALVAMSGFTYFCGAQGVPERVVARMILSYKKDPSAVLNAFWLRCGVTGPRVDGEDIMPDLKYDLDKLKTVDVRGELDPRLPLLALASPDDPLVSLDHMASCFKDSCIHVCPEPCAHGLGVKEAEWAYRRILSFLEGLRDEIW